MRPVLAKPEPRPDVERLDLDASRGRERARRIAGGTGDILVSSIVVGCVDVL